ncbi:MAG: PEP-CTERM sorting domain-containing protein, partial [Desulfobacteraceae bacterium]
MKKTYILLLAVIMIFGYSVSALAGTSFDPLYNTTDGDNPYYVSDGEPVHDHAAPYYLLEHGGGNPPPDENGNTKEVWNITNNAYYDDTTLYRIVKFDDATTTEPIFPDEDGQGDDNPFNISPTVFTSSDSGTWNYTGEPITIDSSTYSDPMNDLTLYFSIKTANGTSEPPGGYNLFVMNDNYNWETDTLVPWSTLDKFFDTTADNLGDHDLSHITFWASVGNSDTPPAPTPEPATVFMLGMGLLVFGSVCRRNRTPTAP